MDLCSVYFLFILYIYIYAHILAFLVNICKLFFTTRNNKLGPEVESSMTWVTRTNSVLIFRQQVNDAVKCYLSIHVSYVYNSWLVWDNTVWTWCALDLKRQRWILFALSPLLWTKAELQVGTFKIYRLSFTELVASLWCSHTHVSAGPLVHSHCSLFCVPCSLKLHQTPWFKFRICEHWPSIISQIPVCWFFFLKKSDLQLWPPPSLSPSMCLLSLALRLPFPAADIHQTVCPDLLALTFWWELLKHLDSQNKTVPLASCRRIHT